MKNNSISEQIILKALKSEINSPIFYNVGVGLGQVTSLLDTLNNEKINHILVRSSMIDECDIDRILNYSNGVIIFDEIHRTSHRINKKLLNMILDTKTNNGNKFILLGDLEKFNQPLQILHRLLLVK